MIIASIVRSSSLRRFIKFYRITDGAIWRSAYKSNNFSAWVPGRKFLYPVIMAMITVPWETRSVPLSLRQMLLELLLVPHDPSIKVHIIMEILGDLTLSQRENIYADFL